MDWLGKLIGLPPVFLACSGGKGGGVIQVKAIAFIIEKKNLLIEDGLLP